MTESEYLRATNRVKVSLALEILRDVLPGKGYGISGLKLAQIRTALREAEEALFKSYGVEEDDDETVED